MIDGRSELVVLKTVDDVRRFRAELSAQGRTLALVPTMGFLHRGHLALMHAAGEKADIVMASIFVNPTQFGPDEDLDTYPRDTEGDLAKAREAGCTAVFMPDVDTMYGDGAETQVNVGSLSQGLCGRSRPTHFAGVCTVVLKLFNITGCDVALFGEKDYQQLAVIRRMVRDLDVPVRVFGHPIVREDDGLAMSSRNAHLSPEQRRQALALSKGLGEVKSAWAAGERNAATLTGLVTARIAREIGAQVDYIQVCNAESLMPVTGVCEGATLVALAVHFGSTRLIDNLVLGGETLG